MLDLDFDDHRPSIPSTVDAHPLVFAAVVMGVVTFFAVPAMIANDHAPHVIAVPAGDQAIMADAP